MNKKSPIAERNEGLKVESDQIQDATSPTTTNEDSDFSSFYSCVSRLVSDYQIKNDENKEKNLKKRIYDKGRHLHNRMQAPRPVKSNPNLCNLANEFSQAHNQLATNTSVETSSSYRREDSDRFTTLKKNSQNESAFANDTKSAVSQNIVLRHSKEEDSCDSSKMLYEARGKADSEVQPSKATKLNKREGSKVKGIKNLLEGISKGWQASKAILRQNSNKSPGSKYEEQHKFDEGKRSPRSKGNSLAEDQGDSYGNYFDSETLDQLIASSDIDHKNNLDEESFNISVKELTLELESAHAQTSNESLFNTPKCSNQKRSSIDVDNAAMTPISETRSKNEVQRNTSYIKNIVEKFESSDCQAN